MKICILICGLKRSIDLVLNNIEEIFINHEINIITCLNNSNEDLELLNNKNIIKKLFINDIYDNSFRNSLNYINKISHGLKIIEPNYDLYIVIRTDLIIKNINLDNIENNKLYFSKKNMNQFTKDIINKVNDNIILTKDYNLLIELINLYKYTINNNNYLDIVLYNYLNSNNIDYELFDIDYKLILSNCNVIAIAGDSGSGKSTLLIVLTPLFNEDSILTLETDRYHKWERGNENYQTYTHLNPYANHLEKMYEDVYDLKIGNEIYQVDYDHSSGRFTQKEKIESKNNIIMCGLHTMYDNKINDILDIKIYLDTDRELIKKWKIQRDVNERGYSMEKVLKQIEFREKDYEEYIAKQKENADIIINFYEENNNLECNLIIQNKNIIIKILKELLKLNYDIKYESNNLIIKLKNELVDIENEIQLYSIFKNNYYREIYYIIKISM
jgi:uridine kinase